MYQEAYYIWGTNDKDDTLGQRWWDVEGVYSDRESAESHRLSLLLSGEFVEVVIVPGPLKID